LGKDIMILAQAFAIVKPSANPNQRLLDPLF